MNRTRALLTNSVILTATSVIVSVIGMYFNSYVSRRIGTQAMGIFALIMSVYIFAVTLAISGIGLAATRLTAEEIAFGRHGGARAAMRRCLIFALIMGIFAAILLATCADFIGTKILHNALTVRPLTILAISLPFTSMSAALTGYFNAMRQVFRSGTALIMEQSVRVFACAQIFMWLAAGRGTEAACAAIALGSVAGEIAGFIHRFAVYIFGRHDGSASPEVSRGLSARMLKITIPMALSMYMKSALSSIKQVMTPICLEKSGASYVKALSDYGIINGMVVPLLLFPSCLLTAISALLVPEIAQLHVTDKRDTINRAVSRAFKLTLFFSTGICAAMFLYAEQLSRSVYATSEAAFYIRIMSLTIPIIYFDNIVDGMLKGLNKQVSVVRINIVDTIATIVMITLIVSKFGTGGYIVVFFLSEILNAGLSIRRLMSTTACVFRVREWVIEPVAAALISLIIMGLFRHINQWAGIPLLLAIYVCVWGYLEARRKEC
ncbi:MAG: oligosaccharide flippase family protein [Clostridiales bacterium]|jgi:stage V sporulation protein B|nr:oligosaccharide flippase family protein [Clostridiales bacterium]